jgi:hypothetical protein
MTNTLLVITIAVVVLVGVICMVALVAFDSPDLSAF